jgi:drug/metabolite transporter (DMT)-like permease
MQNYIGQLAALATSIVWSFTSIFFTIGVRAVGPAMVNRIRLLLACCFLIMSHLIIYNQPLPLQEPFRWFWLGLSGFIGLVLGDGMLFKAYALIGPRMSMLLMTLVPIISAICAWIFLHEVLRPIEVMAIILTVAAVSWIISDKKNSSTNFQPKHYWQGVLLAIGGALGQAFALITAKKGLIGDFPALSAVLIRMFTATCIIWFSALFQRSPNSYSGIFKNSTVRWAILAGAFFGPFIGVWLSLIAIKYTHIGIASTLMALPPIFLIPLTLWIFKEHSSWRAIIGTILAIVGVAMIFLI